jgi:hypothetical protein
MNVYLVSDLGEILIGTVDEVLAGSSHRSSGVGQSLESFLGDHVAEIMSDVDDGDSEGELNLALRVR